LLGAGKLLLIDVEPPFSSSGFEKFQVLPKVLFPPVPDCPDEGVVVNPLMLANGFGAEVVVVEVIVVPKMLPAWVVGAPKILLLAGPLDDPLEADPKIFEELPELAPPNVKVDPDMVLREL
jgi:hypothetical protein